MHWVYAFNCKWFCFRREQGCGFAISFLSDLKQCICKCFPVMKPYLFLHFLSLQLTPKSKRKSILYRMLRPISVAFGNVAVDFMRLRIYTYALILKLTKCLTLQLLNIPIRNGVWPWQSPGGCPNSCRGPTVSPSSSSQAWEEAVGVFWGLALGRGDHPPTHHQAPAQKEQDCQTHQSPSKSSRPSLYSQHALIALIMLLKS